VKKMHKLRETYDNATQQQVPGFVWSSFMLTSDRFDKIDTVIITSQALGLSAIAAMCLLLLQPFAALAGVLAIVLVNLNIIGFLSIGCSNVCFNRSYPGACHGFLS